MRVRMVTFCLPLATKKGWYCPVVAIKNEDEAISKSVL